MAKKLAVQSSVEYIEAFGPMDEIKDIPLQTTDDLLQEATKDVVSSRRMLNVLRHVKDHGKVNEYFETHFKDNKSTIDSCITNVFPYTFPFCVRSRSTKKRNIALISCSDKEGPKRKKAKRNTNDESDDEINNNNNNDRNANKKSSIEKSNKTELPRLSVYWEDTTTHFQSLSAELRNVFCPMPNIQVQSLITGTINKKRTRMVELFVEADKMSLERFESMFDELIEKVTRNKVEIDQYNYNSYLRREVLLIVKDCVRKCLSSKRQKTWKGIHLGVMERKMQTELLFKLLEIVEDKKSYFFVKTNQQFEDILQ